MIDGVLYGKMIGVNIIFSFGVFGGGIVMCLWGIFFLIGNNQLLFIIDGVYISNVEILSGLCFVFGVNFGFEENVFNCLVDLNFEDIESIEVLKGVLVVVIYGIWVNVGVVIIMIKQGQVGKIKVCFEQDFGVNIIQCFVGCCQYMVVEVEEVFGLDEWVCFECVVVDGEVFDYEQEIYGNDGFIIDFCMFIFGGNEKMMFYFNISYWDEEGIIENIGFECFFMCLNVDYCIFDKIKMGVNVNYINFFVSWSFIGNENEGGLSYGYNLVFICDWVNLFLDVLGNYLMNFNVVGNFIFVCDNIWNEECNNCFIFGVNMEVNFYQMDCMIFKLMGNVGVDFLMNEIFVYVLEIYQVQVGGNNGFIGEGCNGLLNYNYQVFVVLDYYIESNINFNMQIGMIYLNFDWDLVFNWVIQLIFGQMNFQNFGVQ